MQSLFNRNNASFYISFLSLPLNNPSSEPVEATSTFVVMDRMVGHGMPACRWPVLDSAFRLVNWDVAICYERCERNHRCIHDVSQN